jgi:hypothetical protein
MTNNKQQSAVDIIYQRMSDKIVMQDVNKGLICIHISHDDFIKLAKQAKEMEEEQMIDFAYKALMEADMTSNRYVDVDKLYNKTYRGNK